MLHLFGKDHSQCLSCMWTTVIFEAMNQVLGFLAVVVKERSGTFNGNSSPEKPLNNSVSLVFWITNAVKGTKTAGADICLGSAQPVITHSTGAWKEKIGDGVEHKQEIDGVLSERRIW